MSHNTKSSGAFEYACFTRPGIFVVNQICQFMHQSTSTHWQAVNRVLRYFKGAICQCLLITLSSNFDLIAYSDADWAGHPDDRRSTGGVCIFLRPNLISWLAKKQSTVFWSNTASEYRSLATAAAELLWTFQLLHELGNHVKTPPALNCVNGSLFPYSLNQFFVSGPNNQADDRYVREQVLNKDLVIQFVSSRCQLDNTFT